MIKTGNKEPSKSTSWKVLETVMSHLKAGITKIIIHCIDLAKLWLGESVRWIFEISARDVITVDYTTIISRTLKVTGNHVMYDRGAGFLMVTMFVQLAVSEEPKRDFHFFLSFNVQENNSWILDSVLVISRLIEVLVRVISLGLRLSENPYLDLDYSAGYHRNLIPYFLLVEFH